MKITALGKSKELIAQTVIVSENSTQPLNTYLFHCVADGKQIATVKGNITEIYPGIMDIVSVPVSFHCSKYPRCTEEYVFYTVHSKRTTTRVTLAYVPSSPLWMCPICRTVLLQLSADTVYDARTRRPVKLPYTTPCQRCGHVYIFADIVR